MGVVQPVWQRLRPYINAVTSHATARPGRFQRHAPQVRLEHYQRARRFVTLAPSVQPFEAGAHHLGLVLAAASAAGVRPAAIPLMNGIAYGVAVRQPDAAALWRELVAQSAGTATYATWTGDWGVVTRLLSECSLERLLAAPDVLVHQFLRTDRRGVAPPEEVGCVVQQWQPNRKIGAKHGPAWSAPIPNPRHATVKWSPEEETTLEVPLLGPVPTLRAFLDDSLLVRPFPIDAVYLWVDGADPAWRQRRDDALRAVGRKAPSEATDNYRFRELGELKFAMRSLEYFAPWIRRVYLLTDQQRPDWLVQDESVITVVDHRDIWDDQSMLPVFNSHAISARLHHIPGLADAYLYINDDMFLGSPVLPRQFFSASGQPIFHNTSSTLPDSALRPGLPTHDNARHNAVRLVTEASGLRPTRLFMHSPYAQSRAWQLELEARYPDWYTRTAASRFRARSDLEPIWLHHYLGAVEGRTVPGSLRYAYVSLADETAPEQLAIIDQNRPHTFCINDDDPKVSEATLDAVTRFLLDYYPVPSRFERPG